MQHKYNNQLGTLYYGMTARIPYRFYCRHNGKFPFFAHPLTGEKGFMCEFVCGFYLNFDPFNYPDGIAYVEKTEGKTITFSKEGTKMEKGS